MNTKKKSYEQEYLKRKKRSKEIIKSLLETCNSKNTIVEFLHEKNYNDELNFWGEKLLNEGYKFENNKNGLN